MIKLLADVLQEYEDDACEADFLDNKQHADNLWRQVARLRERVQQGEIYEVMF